MKLGVIGDLHYSASSPRVGHLLDVLDWVIEDGTRLGVTEWALAGDICEGAPIGNEYGPLVKRITRLGRVFVALGNHCAHDALDWWNHLNGTVRVASRSFIHDPCGEASILVIPYPRRGHTPFDNLVADTIPGSMRAAAERVDQTIKAALECSREIDEGRPVIGIGHFTIQGMTTRDTTFELHHAAEVIVPQTALAGLAFMAVGHIHTAQWLCPSCGTWNHDGVESCRCGAHHLTARVVGVGDLIRNDFAEINDPKSYTVVTVENGQLSWERRPVPAREMATLHIQWTNPSAHLAEIEAFAATCGGKEVKVTVEIPADRLATYDPVLFAPISARAAYFAPIDRRVISIDRVRAPELKAAEGIGDELIAWLNASNQQIDDDRLRRLVALAEAL